MQAGWTNLIETMKSTPVWRPPWRSIPAWVISLLMWIGITLALVGVFGN